MLQWMGGSRRKVATSRKSTQKRQKQYFEQKKRQQQHQQQTEEFESCDEGMDISGEHHREHRSLDVISLLNLSKIAQECRSTCPSVLPSHTNTPQRKDPGINAPKMEFGITSGSPIIQSSSVGQPADFVEYKGTRTPLDVQVETTSQKKISSIVPDSRINAGCGVNSKPDQWNTTAEQPLSVLDLLADDGLNGNIQENGVHEAHVAFSVEGLGKVGTETPVHSPQQPSRAFSYGFSSPLKAAGKLNISKKFNSLLDDLEIEDARMQDIDLPLNGNLMEFSSDYLESLSLKQKSFSFRDTRHHADCSSAKKSYFDHQKEDKWDDRSSFQCDGFFGEREHDISWKTRQSQIDDIAAENLIYRDYNTSDFAFEGPRIPMRTAEKVRDKFDILGSTSPFPNPETSEYNPDFFVSNWSRHPTVERKPDFKPTVSQPERFAFGTEDARDNSSLQSEESCSSSAVRYQETDDPVSNATSRQHKRRGQSNGFAGSGDKYGMKVFANKHKDRGNQENTATGSRKYTNMLDPSRKYQSDSFFQEKVEPKDNWFFEERHTKVDIPGSRSFNQNSGSKNTRFDTNIWDEDPFSEFPPTKQPTGSNHSINGFDDEPDAFFPSGHFTPVKVSSNISKPERPPDSSFIRASKDSSFTGGSPGEPSSLDFPMKERLSGDVEYKVKSKQSNYEEFKLGEEVCITNESLVFEDKDVTDASNSMSSDCEGKEAKYQAVPRLMERVNTAFFPDLVERTSPSADITNRSRSRNHENVETHSADTVPLPYQGGEKENIEDFGPTKRMGNKNKSDYFDSPCQGVMLQSYVFQFFCVQKRLKF